MTTIEKQQTIFLITHTYMKILASAVFNTFVQLEIGFGRLKCYAGCEEKEDKKKKKKRG